MSVSEWREELSNLHRMVLKVLRDDGESHYSEVTAEINRRCGVLYDSPLRQFKEMTINRRLVELRRRGYCVLIGPGTNQITVEGMEFLNNGWK